MSACSLWCPSTWAVALCQTPKARRMAPWCPPTCRTTRTKNTSTGRRTRAPFPGEGGRQKIQLPNGWALPPASSPTLSSGEGVCSLWRSLFCWRLHFPWWCHGPLWSSCNVTRSEGFWVSFGGALVNVFYKQWELVLNDERELWTSGSRSYAEEYRGRRNFKSCPRECLPECQCKTVSQPVASSWNIAIQSSLLRWIE